VTAEHVHTFDEYFVVVEGSCILMLDGHEVCLKAGQEHFIPRGRKISGSVTAGTRTIHVFGGHRAERCASTIGLKQC
jgi:ethanolamine utilization protein EutQ (cupin superfamily)